MIPNLHNFKVKIYFLMFKMHLPVVRSISPVDRNLKQMNFKNNKTKIKNFIIV